MANLPGLRPWHLGALLLLALGCDREPPPRAPDSAAVAALAGVPASWTGSWATELGDLLVIPADTGNTAIVVYPDMPTAELLEGARLHLLGGGGEPVLAGVRVSGADSLECGGAPVVRLSGGTTGGWAIGLTSAGSVLRSDSVESLGGADSARVVAHLARLASTVESGAASRFSALPFTVLRARRFTVSGTRIVAAHLVRKLPQEASPLEEHTFVVAERPVTSDSLRLKFSQRSEGSEEAAEHFEVLSAVAAGSTTLLLLARYSVAGTTYQLLERTPAGAWRVRWTRPLGC